MEQENLENRDENGVSPEAAEIIAAQVNSGPVNNLPEYEISPDKF